MVSWLSEACCTVVSLAAAAALPMFASVEERYWSAVWVPTTAVPESAARALALVLPEEPSPVVAAATSCGLVVVTAMVAAAPVALVPRVKRSAPGLPLASMPALFCVLTALPRA